MKRKFSCPLFRGLIPLFLLLQTTCLFPATHSAQKSAEGNALAVNQILSRSFAVLPFTADSDSVTITDSDVRAELKINPFGRVLTGIVFTAIGMPAGFLLSGMITSSSSLDYRVRGSVIGMYLLPVIISDLINTSSWRLAKDRVYGKHQGKPIRDLTTPYFQMESKAGLSYILLSGSGVRSLPGLAIRFERDWRPWKYFGFMAAAQLSWRRFSLKNREYVYWNYYYRENAEVSNQYMDLCYLPSMYVPVKKSMLLQLSLGVSVSVPIRASASFKTLYSEEIAYDDPRQHTDYDWGVLEESYPVDIFSNFVLDVQVLYKKRISLELLYQSSLGEAHLIRNRSFEKRMHAFSLLVGIRM